MQGKGKRPSLSQTHSEENNRQKTSRLDCERDVQVSPGMMKYGICTPSQFGELFIIFINSQFSIPSMQAAIPDNRLPPVRTVRGNANRMLRLIDRYPNMTVKDLLYLIECRIEGEKFIISSCLLVYSCPQLICILI